MESDRFDAHRNLVRDIENSNNIRGSRKSDRNLGTTPAKFEVPLLEGEGSDRDPVKTKSYVIGSIFNAPSFIFLSAKRNRQILVFVDPCIGIGA